MMKYSILALLFYGLSLFGQVQPVQAEVVIPVDQTTRCQICGMFVAKYPHWVSVIVTTDDRRHYFDGMKDLMVFFLNSEQYGVQAGSMKKIWVKDYYSLSWLDGRVAFFVVGSDVYGPMGHEFIPFATEKAALNFKSDHGGTAVVTFSEITMERVVAMRAGQKMR